jgi:hypothetical protein
MKIAVTADCYIWGQKIPAGCVVDVPEATAQALVEGGVADSDPEAVKAAEESGIVAPELVPPEEQKGNAVPGVDDGAEEGEENGDEGEGNESSTEKPRRPRKKPAA